MFIAEGDGRGQEGVVEVVADGEVRYGDLGDAGRVSEFNFLRKALMTGGHVRSLSEKVNVMCPKRYAGISLANCLFVHMRWTKVGPLCVRSCLAASNVIVMVLSPSSLKTKS